MKLTFALALGAVLMSTRGRALDLFTRPARIVGMRAATVDGTEFVLMHGKLYRRTIEGAPANLSRSPKISKIAAFGHALVALTYPGDLLVWTTREDGRWHSAPLAAHAFADFSVIGTTLIAVDRAGRAFAAHASETSAAAGPIEPLPVAFDDLSEVAGYAPGRGFALMRRDRSRVFLDASGAPCERLLGLR